MYQTALFVALLTALASQSILAAKNAAKLDCASVQSIKTEAVVAPVAGQGIYAVDVTFIGKTPSTKDMDRILRDCVAAAVKRDGSKDILGSAWLRKRASDNPNDDDPLHPCGGLKFLSYEAKSNTISVRDLKLEKKKS